MQYNINQEIYTREKTELKILQVNVVWSGIANNFRLQYAYQHKSDPLLVQESWIGINLERQMSKKHVAFQLYSPEE